MYTSLLITIYFNDFIEYIFVFIVVCEIVYDDVCSVMD